MLALLVIFSYLMGSIPTGYILVKKTLNKDVRDYGSGNIGATNVKRVAGDKLSKITAICDMLKAIIPVLLTRILIWTDILQTNESLSLSLVAIAAILGHNYTIFLKFKGGKGVATAFGAIAPISWGVAGSTLGTWLLVFLISRYSSLSAVITALLVPFYVWWLKPEFTFPVALVCCLLIYRHHDNIQRLWRGQEDKMWGKSKKK